MPDSVPDARPGVAATLDNLTKSADDCISIRELVEKLGSRAFALLILVLALPNAAGLGAIPGLSTVFGVPQIFVALQRMLGYRQPWLPKRLLRQCVRRADLERVIGKSRRHIHRLERLMRPRWRALTSPLAERVLAAVIVLLAMLIALPLPFANQPPAVAIAIISLGMIARDGLVIAFGLAASVLAMGLAAGVVFGGVAAVLALVRGLFG